jgi:ATP-dependent DNA ligase
VPRSARGFSVSHRDLTAPTSKSKAFNDAGWIWELKHDGYRALLIKDGERISLQTPG